MCKSLPRNDPRRKNKQETPRETLSDDNQSVERNEPVADAREWLEGAWLTFLARLRVRRGPSDPALLTFKEALFLARSVAFFAVAHCGADQDRLRHYLRHFDRVLALDARVDELIHAIPAYPERKHAKLLARVTVDRLTDELWCRAAVEILSSTLDDADVSSAFRALRQAIASAGIEGASCHIIDGVDALIAGDFKQAAAVGIQCRVRDGETQDLIDWISARCGPSAPLDQAGRVMDMLAWTLHEVAQSWPGERRELAKLHLGVGRAADWLLFRRKCREALIRLRLVSVGAPALPRRAFDDPPY